MKKNKFMSLAAVLLVLTLVTACFVGGTFAKYASTATGSDTASVAKWSFKVEGTNIGTEQTFTMNLFAMPNDDVKQTDGKIAPGTSGSIVLDFANTSEVNATYNLTLAAEISGVQELPIEYKLDEGAWTSDITTLKITDEPIAMETGTASHTLSWQWKTDNDTADTAIGTAVGDVTCMVTATVVAEQVSTDIVDEPELS